MRQRLVSLIGGLWALSTHPPAPPPSASLIPTFPASPFCKFLNSAQDAQSINKTLSPPLGASAEEATQEPAGLPSKAASVVAPRNANRFGNRQNRDGPGGSGRRIIETAPSCSWAGASQSKIGGQQRETLPTPKDGRHFSPQQSFLEPTPSNTGQHTLTGGVCWTWDNAGLPSNHLPKSKSRSRRYTYMKLLSACKDLALAQHRPVKMVTDWKWRCDSLSQGHRFVGCGTKHYSTRRAMQL